MNEKKIQITYVPTSECIPYSNNPRRNDRAVDIVVKSISENGFKVPIILDKDNVIIAGHTRLKAAKKLGLNEVPVIWAEDLTEAQAKAFRIMDNKTTELADWDQNLLRDELKWLEDADFDATLTGFDFKEIGEIFDVKTTEDKIEVGAYERAKSKTKIQQGQIFKLGNHRLMCGDSTEKTTVDALMAGNKADLVFMDPPYGINIVGKNGKIGAGNLAENQQYPEVIADENTKAAELAFNIIKDYSKNQMIWGGNYFVDWLPFSVNWFIWDKRGEMNSNNFADGEMCWCSFKTPVRIFKQIWSGMIREGESAKKAHPTQKPIKLLAKMLSKAPESESVLDVFGGSGSTLIACQQLNRKCFMMEIDPVYCQVIIDRWEKFTGEKSVQI